MTHINPGCIECGSNHADWVIADGEMWFTCNDCGHEWEVYPAV